MIFINKISLLSFLILLSLAACKKTTYNQLPDATQEGKLTFGYMEGGVVKATSGMMKSGFTNDGLGVKYDLNDNDTSAQITAQNTKQNWYFLAHLSNVNPGVYTVDGINNNVVLSKNWGASTDPKQNVYEPKGASAGTITITKYDGNILSGTFDLKLTNALGETIELKEGRFDIKAY